ANSHWVSKLSTARLLLWGVKTAAAAGRGVTGRKRATGDKTARTTTYFRIPFPYLDMGAGECGPSGGSRSGAWTPLLVATAGAGPQLDPGAVGGAGAAGVQAQS